MHKGNNVHVYPTPLTNESRIQKITGSLAQAGFFDRVIVVGVSREGLPEYETLGPSLEIVRIRRTWCQGRAGTIAKILKTLEWSWRVFRYLRGLDIVCINAHSLPCLPLCVLIAFGKHCRLVYDTHELETETNGLSRWRKLGLKITERLLIHCADQVIVVCDSIAAWYQRAYGIDAVKVVRNVPRLSRLSMEKTPYFREMFAIPDEHLIFIYLGLLSPGRGCDLLVEAFSRLSPDRHIVFMGFGPMADRIAAQAQTRANIHLHPPVRPDEVVGVLRGADAGICLFQNTCLSHAFVSPNKFWECLNAGLPVICSNMVEMARVVTSWDCGWICPDQGASLADLVAGITPEALAAKRTGAFKCRIMFNWEHEEPVLYDAYASMGFRGEVGPTPPAGASNQMHS